MKLSTKMLGKRGARGRGETASSATLCNRVLSANEVINMVVGELSRTGRNAIRSMSTPRDDRHDDAQQRDDDPRQGTVAEEQKTVAANHDQLAIGEIDEAQDAVDDDQSERHQGVEPTEGERGDEVLDTVVDRVHVTVLQPGAAAGWPYRPRPTAEIGALDVGLLPDLGGGAG